MAFDYVDFLVDTAEEKLTGLFYSRRPTNADDGRKTFQYKQLDPNSKVFGKVLGEVRADRATYAIKTNDGCGFNIGGYVVTQNGLIWQITEVVTNEEAKDRTEVLRWFKSAKNAEIDIRMVQVDNLYPIEDSYTDMCAVTVEFPVGAEIVSAVVHVGADEQATIYKIVGNTVSFEVEKGDKATIEYEYKLNGATKTGRKQITRLKTTKNEYSTNISA